MKKISWFFFDQVMVFYQTVCSYQQKKLLCLVQVRKSRKIEFYQSPSFWKLKWSLDHAAPNARPGIASGLGLEIIRVGMNYYASAQNATLPAEAQSTKNGIDRCNPLTVGFDIAEISRMMLTTTRSAVRGLSRIKVTSRRRAIWRGTIPLLVNVEAVLSGRESLNLASNSQAFGFLGESDGPMHKGITQGTNYGDCVWRTQTTAV
jgi:hypothetical protein